MNNQFISTACRIALGVSVAAWSMWTHASEVARTPPGWTEPIPALDSAANRVGGWAPLDDPLLARLINAAQQVSPDVASAAARIAQSRADWVASGASLLPAVDASVGVQRARPDLVTPITRTAFAGATLSWEWDLFGGLAAGQTAARQRLGAAQAGWHDARVSVAAEVASVYLSLRACEATRTLEEADVGSRRVTAQLTDASARAGFVAPWQAAQAHGAVAQATIQARNRQVQCGQAVKALTALTALDAAELTHLLAPGTGRLPPPVDVAVPVLPAQALAQRPDLVAAGAAVLAAAADTRQTEADRLPRISFAGQFNAVRARTADARLDGNVWSIGPLQVTLPVFDTGKRQARVDSARAQYDQTVSAYGARLRTAVREVEDALLRVNASAPRQADARVAETAAQRTFAATEAKARAGLASLLELEEARRALGLAVGASVQADHERADAMVALYRALGGGWRDTDAPDGASALALFGESGVPGASPSTSSPSSPSSVSESATGLTRLTPLQKAQP